MIRELIMTKDGSPSMSVPDMKVTYHSIYGAITESMHVFITAGLLPAIKLSGEKLNVFEMGLGTGLNVFLTFLESPGVNRSIYYEAIENNPLEKHEFEALQYPAIIGKNQENVFRLIHTSPWNEEIKLSPDFVFKKNQVSLLEFYTDNHFDLIYFDAFAPTAQPELWTEEVFNRLYSICNPGAYLVTYCAKGDVRRAMKAAGFRVEKLKGPPGKREMLRACVQHELPAQC